MYKYSQIFLISLIYIIVSSDLEEQLSIDKYCGEDNDNRQLVIHFDKFEGINMTQVGHSNIHIVSATGYDLTIKGILKDNIITYNQKISLGYFCKTDGVISIKFSNIKPFSAIALNKIWNKIFFEQEHEFIVFIRTDINHQIGDLKLKIGLYKSKCRESCRRQIKVKILKPNILFQYMERRFHYIEDQKYEEVGESCEPLTNIIIGEMNNNGDYNIKYYDLTKSWASGEHKINDQLFIKISEMDDSLCLIYSGTIQKENTNIQKV